MLVVHLWCGKRQLAYGGSPRSWPRRLVSLSDGQFRRVMVAPILGEVQGLRWRQQCTTTIICGVQRKDSVAALSANGYWHNVLSLGVIYSGLVFVGWLRSTLTGVVATCHAC